MKGKIFNAQEVQAIIAGDKTMFREVIKPQPNEQQKYLCHDDDGNTFLTDHDWADYLAYGDGNEIKCPYQVGQKIFCKESFFESFSNTYYRADIHDNGLSYYTWKPAQHMKQQQSRLTLQIKEIRVERFDELWNWVIDFEVVK